MSRDPIWATDLVFDSIGTVIRIRSEDQEFGDLIADQYRHFPVTNRAADVTVSLRRDRGRNWVYREDDRVSSTGSQNQALMDVLHIVNEASLEGTSFSLLVHAGAVALGGEVIAFPASAGSGKSTLVAACLMEGFDYVTDEGLVVLSEEGDISPYPKAVWLTAESRSLLSGDDSQESVRYAPLLKAPIMPEDLGAVVAEPPLHLRHLVLPEWGADSTELEPLGPAQTATQLMTHAFNRYDRPREWFDLTTAVTRKVSGWRLRYGAPAEAAALLRRLLEDS
jgi:hypothetical protein